MKGSAPRLLDLCCGAGGAGEGYRRAGFDVFGVDRKWSRRYPDQLNFFCGDAYNYLINHYKEFDFVHASPPCQGYSQLTPKKHRKFHTVDLIPMIREFCSDRSVPIPYIIENVPAAKHVLVDPVMLCGSMFGLGVQRHRYFEIGFKTKVELRDCDHAGPIVRITGSTRAMREGREPMDRGKEFSVGAWRNAMGIEWMSKAEIFQAIPPAYTEYLGKFAMKFLTGSIA